MQSEDAIREDRERVAVRANAPEDSMEREIARAVCHALSWVLDETMIGNSRPSEQFGFATMRFTPEALEVVRFKREKPD